MIRSHYVRGVFVLTALLMATAAPAHARYSKAYKSSFDLFHGVQLDHTYFCLNKDNDGRDCFAIEGFGVSSAKSGGAGIAGTYHGKNAHERCLARARASNKINTVCGALSQLYGVNGVCHQHTNRGQLSMHGDYIDPGKIKGGWFSYLLFGPYGKGYAACAAESEALCLLTW